MMATPERPADRLRVLADQVRRLLPDRRDPERFHVTKSELAAELRQLARELDVAAKLQGS